MRVWGQLTDEEKTLALVGAGGLVALAFWKGPLIVTNVVDVFERGRRLNHTTLNDQDFIDDDPDSLVAEAESVMGISIGRDIYAMARSGRSEGADGMEYRMHVFLTQAGGLDNVFNLTVRSTHAYADGRFGEQLGRRWASSRDPYEGDVRLALKVAADRAAGIDPTGGATNFVDRDSFGVQAGTGRYDALVAKWAGQGLVPYNLPGATSNFVLFRPGSIPDGATPA